MPVDSTATIVQPIGARAEVRQPASRNSSTVFADGGHDADHADPRAGPVRGRLPDVRRRTRRAIQTNLVGFGNALAGAGLGAQRHVREPAPAAALPRPVAKYLSAPSTELTPSLAIARAGSCGTGRAGRARRARAVHGDGDDVRGDLEQPQRARVDDRESPSTSSVTTSSLQGPAAVPGRPRRARPRADARDRSTRVGAAGDQPRDRSWYQDARAHAGAEREAAAGDERVKDARAAPGTNIAVNGADARSRR